MGISPEELQKVREGLDKPPPERFEFTPENPEVIGKLVRVEVATSDYGPFPILILEQEDGEEVGVAAFHGVLRSELERKGADIGALIGIRCLGKRPSPTPGRKEYMDYKVYVIGGNTGALQLPNREQAALKVGEIVESLQADVVDEPAQEAEVVEEDPRNSWDRWNAEV